MHLEISAFMGQLQLSGFCCICDEAVQCFSIHCSCHMIKHCIYPNIKLCPLHNLHFFRKITLYVIIR